MNVILKHLRHIIGRSPKTDLLHDSPKRRHCHHQAAALSATHLNSHPHNCRSDYHPAVACPQCYIIAKCSNGVLHPPGQEPRFEPAAPVLSVECRQTRRQVPKTRRSVFKAYTAQCHRRL